MVTIFFVYYTYPLPSTILLTPTAAPASLQVDTTLSGSFYYLPYLGMCKLQNVLLNIYCNFANELFMSVRIIISE